MIDREGKSPFNILMARQARIVIPNTPHHITQRGNRGEKVFFEKEDYQIYLDILLEQCGRFKISLLSYCLMPNQIHIIAVPENENFLARAIGETHRRYSCHINTRQDWRGHLFQDRFFSYPMDEQNALRAARFIETLPVTAGIAPKPENYLWSSAKARIKVIHNPILKPFRSFHTIHNWGDYLSRPMDLNELKTIQLHLQTGRPRGGDIFLDSIEKRIGRQVRPNKRGRKPKDLKKKAVNA
jgi:putative transposase